MHTITLAPTLVNAGLVKVAGLAIRRQGPYSANSVTLQFFANPIVAERMVVVTLEFDLQGVHVHPVEMDGVLYEVALLSIRNEGQFNLPVYELTVTPPPRLKPGSCKPSPAIALSSTLNTKVSGADAHVEQAAYPHLQEIKV